MSRFVGCIGAVDRGANPAPVRDKCRPLNRWILEVALHVIQCRARVLKLALKSLGSFSKSRKLIVYSIQIGMVVRVLTCIYKLSNPPRSFYTDIVTRGRNYLVTTLLNDVICLCQMVVYCPASIFSSFASLFI